MKQHLFVYGTLRKDAGNSMFHILAGHAQFAGYGRIPGRLYDLGDFPGAVPSTDQDGWIRGEVYALNDAGYVLAALDDYEGCGPEDTSPHEFERVMHEIKLEDGEKIPAWVYVYRGAIEKKPEIPSGNYFGGAF